MSPDGTVDNGTDGAGPTGPSLADFAGEAAGDSLSVISPSVARKLETVGVRRRWRAGQIVIWSGTRPDSACIVLRGKLRIRTNSYEGNERILGWLGPGRGCAIAHVLLDVPHPWDAVADGPCTLLHLERGRLRQLMAEDAEVASGVAMLLAARVNRLLEKLVQHSFVPLSDRVRQTLRRGAGLAGAEATLPVTLRMTQGDLARSVGGSRYRVGLVLKELESEGIVRLSRGVITVLRRP